MDNMATLPKYWEQLSPEDQASYTSLQHDLASPSRKNRRNRSLATFGEIMEAIKLFVVRHTDDDWKRALVCGICWFDSTIAINIRQLRLLVSKCKSSINGSFQLLGYGIIASGSDCNIEIVKRFPILKDNFAELRQWTLRCTQPPTAFVSPAPEAHAFPEAIGIELAFSTLPEIVHSPTEPLRETDGFAACVFEDPLSFMPGEPELKGWYDIEEDIKQKDFGFPDLDL
jgi:hypothetical protein